MSKGCDLLNEIIVFDETKIVNGRTYQKIKCHCGNVTYMRKDYLKKAKSCGCLHKNKYGLKSSDYEKLYGVWSSMKKRCYSEKSDRYYAYGAKGIGVCDEWKEDFHNFAKWAVKNGWENGLSIERNDIKKSYSPENCCFIPLKLQARNKSNNVFIKYKGQTKCVAEWCFLLGLKDKTVYKRIKDGHTNPEEILYIGNLRSFKKEVFA